MAHQPDLMMTKEPIRCNIHLMDWKDSIAYQLQLRKSDEQIPFEEICRFASSTFERVDIYKSENIQLNLQKEQLQQQLLGIQQTILAGGSVAAKSILSKFPDSGINADTLKARSDSLQNIASNSALKLQISELKAQLEEKERVNQQLNKAVEERDKEIVKLNEELKRLDGNLKTITDEHLALTLSYKSLEKRYDKLQIDNDSLKTTILAVKLNDAERLNAENERVMRDQQDRIKRELEVKVAAMNNLQLGGQDTAGEDFGILDEDENMFSYNRPSKIPSGVEFAFNGYEANEACALNWYSCSGPRDDYLATGGTDRKVTLWKIQEGEGRALATLLGSNASITSIDIEADAILASSNDFATRIWSVNDHKLRKTLTGHAAKVNSAKFLGVPNKAASGSMDRTIKTWDIDKGACLRTYFAGSNCLDLVYNNYQVISGHLDGKIRCWDLTRPDNEPTSQIALQAKTTSLDVSRDGTKLICSLRDNTIKCLELRKMEVLQTYSDEKFRIGLDNVRAKFSIDGQLISCGSHDGSLYIWDANTAKVEKVLTGHTSTVLASCWSPDGQRIATIERGKKISIWI